MTSQAAPAIWIHGVSDPRHLQATKTRSHENRAWISEVYRRGLEGARIRRATCNRKALTHSSEAKWLRVSNVRKSSRSIQMEPISTVRRKSNVSRSNVSRAAGRPVRRLPNRQQLQWLISERNESGRREPRCGNRLLRAGPIVS